MKPLRWIAAMALWAMPVAAWAQAEAEPASLPVATPAEPSATPAGAVIRIPAGLDIEVEVTEALSSKTSLQGQLFGLRLAAPIIVDGREIVAAGAIGGGEVIDAHPAAFGGRQGRLILSGRFLEIGGQRVRIRAMTISGAGSNRVNAALGVSFAIGPGAFLIEGGEMTVPVGTRATARIAVDVDVQAPTIAVEQAPVGASEQTLASGDEP